MKRRSRLDLTEKDFQEWKQQYYLSNRNERLGQAFCNDHRLTHMELFYEEVPANAEKLIRESYVKEGL